MVRFKPPLFVSLTKITPTVKNFETKFEIKIDTSKVCNFVIEIRGVVFSK